MSDKITRQKIILTPYDPDLTGKINGEAEHVHVLLDTTVAAFTVALPSVTATMKRELLFKNIGANDATIISQAGQYCDLSTSIIIRPLDLVSLWADLIKTWWIQGVTSGSLTRNWRSIEDTVTGDLIFQKNVSGVWIEKARMF
jgi:hypothetical protein